MKLYGRAQEGSSKLKLLEEITVLADPSALRDLASFLYRCADAIEDEGESWEQGYFESNEEVSPEVVVFNPMLVDD